MQLPSASSERLILAPCERASVARANGWRARRHTTRGGTMHDAAVGAEHGARPVDARARATSAAGVTPDALMRTSLSRCPVLSVLLARSEPARSTIDSLPIRTLPVTCAVASDCSMVTCSTACERLETWFAAVGSTVRYRLPRCSSSRISAAESAPYSVNGGRQEEVLDALVVDLHVRERHLELGLLEPVHPRVQVVQRVDHHAGVLERSEHRVRLAGASGAIGEDGRVVAIEHAAHQVLGRLIVHLILPDLVVKDHVERVLLLLGAVWVEVGVVPRVDDDDDL
eukprot:1004660-Prymnesium_polylepis.1